jgi:hypothetical protein
VLNKRIEITWLTKLNVFLNHSLGTSSLAMTIICLELTSVLSLMLRHHVRIEIQVWLEFFAFVGPVFCLFLVGLLIIAYFRNNRRETGIFLTGAGAGLISFGIWLWWAAMH